MMTWWHYLLLSNLYLILFFGFYVLLLQRETFFQLNRIYLVGSAVMSFLIPVIQLDWVKQWFITQKVQQTIYSAEPGVIYHMKAIQPDQVTAGELLVTVYITGIVVLSVRLLWQLVVLNRVIKNKPALAAWSFFKKIRVDEDLEGKEVIAAHEEVHARQWHSADVLLVEVIMILNWFNPVVYLYRKAVKQTHEFIADRDALKAGTTRADYALLLLSQTFNAPVHHLLNPFFSSSALRQRILMLQKNKSHYSALIKYGFSAPLFILMLALSSATINNSTVVKAIKKEAEQMLSAEVPVVNNARVMLPEVVVIKHPAAIKVVQPQFKINTDFKVNDMPTAVEMPGHDSIAADENHEIFTSVEKLPYFPGGVNAFFKFLSKNLRYPSEAQQRGVQGRVNVTFVIERNGSLSGIRALNNLGGGLLNDEAVRVMLESPKWVPGEQNGHTVAVQYTVPVVFTLTENQDKVDTVKTNFQPLRFQGAAANTKPAYLKNDSSNTAIGANKTVLFKANSDKAAALNYTILLDGKELPAGKAMASIEPNRIARIDVVKTPEAAKLYGKKYDKNLILITTKK